MARTGRDPKGPLHFVLGGVMGLGALFALKMLWDTFFSGNNVGALGAGVAAGALSYGAWHCLWRWHHGPPSKPTIEPSAAEPADPNTETAMLKPKKKKKGKKKKRRRR